MRLVDMLMQAKGPLDIMTDTAGLMRLPGVERFAAEVGALPARYVLMEDVARACGDLILRQPDLLAGCADLLRVPAQQLWIEWWTHQLVDGGPPARPQRAGMLVQADEGGRSGSLRSFYENELGGVDYFPGVMRFDFDAPPPSIARPGCNAAYSELLGSSSLELDPEWRQCYRLAAGPDLISYQAALNKLWRDGFKDCLILFAFCLLLGARAGLAFARPDLDKLNRARARRGKPTLVDHIEVSAHIFGSAGGEERAIAGVRSATRLHHVRGHWVRRGQCLFWRRSHLRGSASLGCVPARTTRLHLGRQLAVGH